MMYCFFSVSVSPKPIISLAPPSVPAWTERKNLFGSAQTDSKKNNNNNNNNHAVSHQSILNDDINVKDVNLIINKNNFTPSQNIISRNNNNENKKADYVKSSSSIIKTEMTEEMKQEKIEAIKLAKEKKLAKNREKKSLEIAEKRKLKKLVRSLELESKIFSEGDIYYHVHFFIENICIYL